MSNQYTWLMSKDKMYINGISSDTVGILVDTPPMPPMAAEKVESIHIIGRADSTYFHTGTYEDITISVKCYVFDYGQHPDAIYKYLHGAKTLSFSTADDVFYRVKHVTGIVPSYSGKGKNLLTVNFICSPFKYTAHNDEMMFARGESESLTIQLFNAGSVYSEPVYRIPVPTGTPQTGTISVNGVSITIIPTDGTDVYIDLTIMEIYKIVSGVKTRVTSISGKWWDLILKTGYNEITFTGIEKLCVTKNERFL